MGTEGVKQEGRLAKSCNGKFSLVNLMKLSERQQNSGFLKFWKARVE